jgi:4-hydroxy-tetrahydrodipicolinate reductase
VRELASRLAGLAEPRIHSVRLPGYVISAEIIFGMPDQRLSIRHDAGNGPRPYVDGALLAIRNVGSLTGLHRGLDEVLHL